ncbi:hypothetical protein M8818_001452 [Zalaria obscura]|uniref:Uncharacterized protein n=1 Tax=Zalaria obscura TaxID=2024903 RepID=A0ACC3SLU8_9PEZI
MPTFTLLSSPIGRNKAADFSTCMHSAYNPRYGELLKPPRITHESRLGIENGDAAREEQGGMRWYFDITAPKVLQYKGIAIASVQQTVSKAITKEDFSAMAYGLNLLIFTESSEQSRGFHKPAPGVPAELTKIWSQTSTVSKYVQIRLTAPFSRLRRYQGPDQHLLLSGFVPRRPRAAHAHFAAISSGPRRFPPPAKAPLSAGRPAHLAPTTRSRSDTLESTMEEGAEMVLRGWSGLERSGSEVLANAGITHCFVNLGSDHPSIIEAIVKGQNEKKGQFPRIITCPNEMVALSMADGYARLTNKPQCVIVHVDVGTQGLGAAVHNASCGRAPVLIFAGLSPYTIEGEYRGSRTEYIHWIQDVPDQKAIVAQYCRYAGEIKRGANVKQLVNRALSFATSEPRGPVYLVGSREAMEEDLEPYHLDQKFWNPVEPAALAPKQVERIAHLLVEAEEPLVVTGYSGRNHAAVAALVRLADLVKGIKVLDTGGSDMCFPANHPAWLGLRYGNEAHIKSADVLVVLDCDVPWIPTQCHPRSDAHIIHIDVDPLKQQMPVFYINAEARYRADSETSITQLADYIEANLADRVQSDAFQERWHRLQEFHEDRIETINLQARPGEDGTFACSYLMARVKAACPPDTIWCVEAVTNTAFVADQLQCSLPGSWINCGGGGLGWSGGGALGVKLAADFEAGGTNKGKFVCQIVGDGTYLFSVPGSVYWIAQRYGIPVLTIVLNNKGWNAPRKSLLLVHPDGEGSKVSNEELNISFAPTPDYSGIARAASGGKCWAGHAGTVDELNKKLSEAVAAVKEGRCAVLDAHLDGPQGKFGGGEAVLIG